MAYQITLYLLVLSLLTGAPVVRAETSGDPETLVAEAVRLIESGEMEQAEKQFVKAAKTGGADIRYQLGQAYLEGDFGFPDGRKALKWMKKAAGDDHAGAQLRLGEFYLKGYATSSSPRKAAKWFRKAAGQGNIEACKYLGVMYYTGEGIKQDYEAAVKYLKPAADAGDTLSLRTLSKMYFDGEGIPTDATEGLRMLTLSAESGDVVAQSELGIRLATGNGVAPDPAAARHWWELAAEQGDAVSMKFLERVYREGLGVTPDPARADAWLERREAQVIDYEPVHRQAPVYPRKALDREIQGRAVYQFDITELGDVENITLLESAPPGMFDKAGADALAKFKYTPRLIGGNPVRAVGVVHEITWELEGVDNPRGNYLAPEGPRYFPPSPPPERPVVGCPGPGC
ncbi:MAG: TonB family protein [Gammaproteobacteria bacterium]|nr:TonB family protein [Gammaproteobacteria bacterium]